MSLPRTSCFVKPVLLIVICIAVVSTMLSGHHMLTDVGGDHQTIDGVVTRATMETHKKSHPLQGQLPPYVAALSGAHAIAASTSIDDLGRIGRRRVFLATSLDQIHHGIYKTTVELEKGMKTSSLRFAFKTECRPAAKWHGQQGWGEIAVHNLLSIWEKHFSRVANESSANNALPESDAGAYQFENTVPYAVGGILYVTTSMLNTIIHKDQCGLMTSQQIDAYLTTLAQQATFTSSEDREASAVATHTIADVRAMRDLSTPAATLHPLMGVLLTWMPSVDDSAIPLASLWLKDFIVPETVAIPPTGLASGTDDTLGSSKLIRDALLSAVPSKSKNFFKKSDFLTTNIITKRQAAITAASPYPADIHLEVLRQISDIMLFDYLLGNEDREEKNWFRDANSGRYILMDNGFVFSGRGYKESICSSYPSLLLCPPLLRHLSKSPKCRRSTSPSPAALCVFRPETVQMLQQLKKDWLGDSYVVGGGSESSSAPSSMAFKWLSRSKSDVLLLYLATTFSSQSTSVYDVPLARYRNTTADGDCDRLTKRLPSTGSISFSSLSSTDGLEFIALALQMRIEKLLGHIHTCLSRHGSKTVFSSSQMSV